jgi:hypothetical protein
MSANALIPHTSIRRVNADGITVFYRVEWSGHITAARLSNIFVSISGVDSTPCGPLPSHRSGSSRIRIH